MIQNNIKQKILEYFFINPTEKIRIRQLTREINTPLPSTIRYVKELIKESVLKKEEVAKTIMYSANRTSREYLLQKRTFNLESIYHSKMIDYLKGYNAKTIILFGSYNRGEDTEDSDIDIYIECKNAPDNIQQFEKTLRRRIQIFKFKDIKSVGNKDLANNILNGTIIEGFIEVFK